MKTLTKRSNILQIVYILSSFVFDQILGPGRSRYSRRGWEALCTLHLFLRSFSGGGTIGAKCHGTDIPSMPCNEDMIEFDIKAWMEKNIQHWANLTPCISSFCIGGPSKRVSQQMAGSLLKHISCADYIFICYIFFNMYTQKMACNLPKYYFCKLYFYIVYILYILTYICCMGNLLKFVLFFQD